MRPGHRVVYQRHTFSGGNDRLPIAILQSTRRPSSAKRLFARAACRHAAAADRDTARGSLDPRLSAGDHRSPRPHTADTGRLSADHLSIAEPGRGPLDAGRRQPDNLPLARTAARDPGWVVLTEEPAPPPDDDSSGSAMVAGPTRHGRRVTGTSSGSRKSAAISISATPHRSPTTASRRAASRPPLS